MYSTKEYPLERCLEKGNEIVEITLMRFQLSRRYDLYNMLLTYSVGRQPSLDQPGDKITFHFTRYDWRKTLRQQVEKNLLWVVNERKLIPEGKTPTKK